MPIPQSNLTYLVCLLNILECHGFRLYTDCGWRLKCAVLTSFKIFSLQLNYSSAWPWQTGLSVFSGLHGPVMACLAGKIELRIFCVHVDLAGFLQTRVFADLCFREGKVISRVLARSPIFGQIWTEEKLSSREQTENQSRLLFGNVRLRFFIVEKCKIIQNCFRSEKML